MKQVSARQVRKKYKDYLKEYLRGDSFWTDSYYLGSTGGANLDVIEEYIKKQGQPKRKYVRKNGLSSRPRKIKFPNIFLIFPYQLYYLLILEKYRIHRHYVPHGRENFTSNTLLTIFAN